MTQKHLIDEIYDTFETIEDRSEKLDYLNKAAIRLSDKGFTNTVIQFVLEDLGTKAGLIDPREVNIDDFESYGGTS